MYFGITNGALTFPADKASPLARNIITLLLDKNPVTRLGSRGGVLEVRSHSFFADIDWQALLAKKYQAPWIPPKEANCFDVTYTQQPVLNSVVMSQPNMNMGFPDFAGFSWNAPNIYPENSPPAEHGHNFCIKGSPPPASLSSIMLPKGSVDGI